MMKAEERNWHFMMEYHIIVMIGLVRKVTQWTSDTIKFQGDNKPIIIY